MKGVVLLGDLDLTRVVLGTKHDHRHRFAFALRSVAGDRSLVDAHAKPGLFVNLPTSRVERMLTGPHATRNAFP